MPTAQQKYRGPDAEGRNAVIALAAYGSRVQQCLARALDDASPTFYAQPRPGAPVDPALSAVDLLCLVVGDDPAAIEQARAQLQALRAADRLSLVLAPRDVQPRLAPWADALGGWPDGAGEEDLVAARRQRRAASSLTGWIAGLERLLRDQGLVCVDFADVRCIIHRAGPAALAIGLGHGRRRLDDALAQLRASLSAQGVDRHAYSRAILSIRGSAELSVGDFDYIAGALRELLPTVGTQCLGLRVDEGSEGVELGLLLAGQVQGEPDHDTSRRQGSYRVPKILKESQC
ncbi:hypothetical protein [Alkalilimnicola sp. S0819]|uniref:hypothetical protein n=1 Tax=Alkalilimnicola sp. S0819 TaxID=2613922 RepID=UPI0012617062|nr:hypothetical protein [Alkalilimnicola sp. S0819]KAB7624102.1 hypothetical protein F3N43_06855 [Alkalilimnicola sp. S0819]MPQ16353.1 hypothetical protein [Alkalilimnicola sp. S0819]